MHRALSNPLTEAETTDARRFDMFFLCRDVRAEHSVDGTTVIPAGRWIYIVGHRKPLRDAEYTAAKMLVAAPDRVDTTRGLTGMSVIKSPRHKPFRFMVIPSGKELEYYRLAKSRRG